MCIVTTDLHITADNDSDTRRTRPFLREGFPCGQNGNYVISSHEPRMWLNTKTD
jgi:hypothetical protein